MGTDVSDLTARAKELISGRRYQEAVRACRRVLLARPDEVHVRLLLGTALLALRRYDEVRVEMLALIRRRPEETAAHRLLGEAYLRTDQYDKAQKALQRAVDLDPSDEATRELLAEVEGEEPIPESSTIERWFSADAMATMETDLGEVEELAGEATQVTEETPAATPGDSDAQSRPSVEVDPALAAEPGPPAAEPGPPRAEPGPVPAAAPPGRPPDKSTARAQVGEDTRSTPSDVAAAYPDFEDGTEDYTVDESSEELFTEGSTASGSRGDPRSDAVAPITSATKRARPEPTPEPQPQPEPPSRKPKRTMLGLGPAADSEREDPSQQTAAGRRGARQGDSPAGAPPPGALPAAPGAHSAAQSQSAESLDSADIQPIDSTSELSIEDVEEVDAAPVARNPLAGGAVPSFPDGSLEAPDDVDTEPLEAAPTQAQSFASDDEDELLEDTLDAEPTRARGTPLSEASATGAPSGPSPGPPGAPSPRPPPAWSGSPPPPAPAASSGAGASAAAAQPQVARGARTPTKPGRRGKRPPLALLAVAALLPIVLLVGGGVGVWLWLGGQADEEVTAAIQQATDDGLKSSLDRAIRVAKNKGGDEPEDLARRARLRATAVLEHGEAPQAATDLLSRLEGDEQNLPNARVARAYLALARGDVETAKREVDGVEGEGNVAVEASRARAKVASARGELERAVAHARSAVAERPSSPRHVSLFALLTALHGDAAAALNALDGLPEGSKSPAVRITRARILQESGSDPEHAVEEATAVLEQLGSNAAPYQKAWAHLIRARHAAESGDSSEAAERARKAAELQPPGDERFGLSLVAIFLQAGEAKQARSQLERLPKKSTQTERRALLEAEVALAHDDIGAAEKAVAEADDGPRAAYVRGRIAEARDELDDARELYQKAAGDPGMRVRARTRLGALALREGDSARAVELLEQAHERAPADPDLVPLFVRALIEDGEADRAEKVIRTALGRQPEAPVFRMAEARVQMAQGEVEDALETLRDLADARADDAEVHVALGEAALRAGRRTDAAGAFDRALELDSDHRGALLGRVHVTLDALEPEAAEEAIRKAEEAGVDEDALERVEARLLVLQGRGLEAAEALEEVPESERDASTWASLGWAYAQAEDERDAARAFREALELDEGHPWAHLGMAWYWARRQKPTKASHSIGKAERAAQRRGLAEEYEVRLLVARARRSFGRNVFEETREIAEKAIEKDPDNAAAHLLLAHVARELGDPPLPHLERAVDGRMPFPEAFGYRIAVKDPKSPSEELCRQAKDYMEAAPKGYDAPDVRRVLNRCD